MNEDASKRFEELRQSVYGAPQPGQTASATGGTSNATSNAAPDATSEPAASAGTTPEPTGAAGTTPEPTGAAGNTGAPVQAAGVGGDGNWLASLLVPVQETRNWLKFLGVVSIVTGGILALTIVGLLFAWLYIWVGVLLWQAGDRANAASLQRDPALFGQYMQRLRTVIIICGVVVAAYLVLAVVAIGFFVTLGGVAAMMHALS